MKRDTNRAARVARAVRLPVVLKHWTRHLSSYEIRDRVQEETGQDVTPRTIQNDIKYLRTQVAESAAEDVETLRRDAIATCDRAIAELWTLYDNADIKAKTNDVESVVIMDDKTKSQTAVPLKSRAGTIQRDNVRKVKILAEIREWEKMRNQLLGIDIKHIDIKSGGQTFTGFASVLPVVPDIEQIVAEVDRRRAEQADE